MTTLTAPRPAAPATAARAGRLSPRAAFYLQISIIVFLLAGSSAPTPLYALYQAEWGFSPITVTVVFGVYALAVLVALLIFGSLSDHVGRRPVLLAAVIVQAATMLVFATAGGVSELLLARVIQGLSTGAAVGALGAGLLDLDRVKGAVANAVAPMTGTAVGALGSGLLVQFLPDPARLVYLVLFGVFTVQALGVALMPETVTRVAGALGSLRPRVGVPPNARRPLLLAAPAIVAVWALAGFYGSLGPTLMRLLTGSHSFVLGGLALFTLAGSGAVGVLLLRAVAAQPLMMIGVSALFAGVGLTLVAIATTSIWVFFLGAIAAGVGFGAAFQGALRTVLPLAAAHERAGVLSAIYVVSYLAMGLPAVIAGYLVVHGGGVLATAREYGLGVMLLAAIVLLGTAWTARARRLAVIR
ncbi:MFS family permease [Allocatelliglobosispora scoriae]|uniref:MFS family permease n=1 Tax=Allocatelliglobosispora scoriae TaxID=643052 RepID=A0A841BNM5_9ACTN|nr:MFS transporter [Allocatelliglobosispora scoriae]MBB5868799.1 MFS family permease [Allocatelliglobosispora scoriae]